MKHIDRLEEYIMMVTFPLMVILVVAATAVRYFELGSMAWGEELARYCMIFSVYAGIAMGFKHDSHLGVSFFVGLLPDYVKPVVNIIRTLLILIFGLLVGYYAFAIILRQMRTNQISSAMQIPIWYVYSILPLGSMLIIARTLQSFFKNRSAEKSKKGGSVA